MVNINDVKTNSDDWKGDRLEAIFKRQQELMEKYHDIEKANGLLQTEDVPVSLHDRFGQTRLKDFAWRATEELGEALDAFTHSDNMDHCWEELADALHFLAEFTILAGMTPEDLVVILNAGRDAVEGDYLDQFFYWSEPPKVYPQQEMMFMEVGRFIQYMGMACNCFKNKPWKQSHMLTDVKEFYKWVVKAWKAFIGVCDVSGLTPRTLILFYFGKSEVNKFRQRSNY